MQASFIPPYNTNFNIILHKRQFNTRAELLIKKPSFQKKETMKIWKKSIIAFSNKNPTLIYMQISHEITSIIVYYGATTHSFYCIIFNMFLKTTSLFLGWLFRLYNFFFSYHIKYYLRG